MHTRFLIVATVMAAAAGLARPPEARQPERPPNIILIVADDLGWADIGANGSSFFLTPRIDALAHDGMRFTSAYAAAPVCSPTRAALLTGKHPARLHITDWLPGRGDRPDQKLARPAIRQGLPHDEVTLPEALRQAGYVSGHVGKWHLGGDGSGPRDHGFDLNVAGDHTGTPLSYFAPFARDGRAMPGLERAGTGEYLTDRLTDEAVRFVESNRHRPFFLYLSHYAPHTPLRAKPALVERHAARAAAGPQTNAIYAAMLESLDEGVGRLLERLETLDLAERTVVIFTSDNGGLSTVEGPNTPATSNAPLRNGKGYLHEGGIRVPLLVRWPGRVPAGAVEGTPVISTDIFPTLLALAGSPSTGSADGVSLDGLLARTAAVPTRPLYWHYPHYSNQARSPGAPAGGGPGAAMREGRWKLIQHFESGVHELYDLEADPGERHNLAEADPERVIAMGRQLHAWQNAVGAQWPTRNPAYRASPIAPAADGTVVLHARDALVHGEVLRYEPQPHKNTLGFWTRVEDWAEWEFELPAPGRYRVEALQGCGAGSGGAHVDFAIGDARLTLVVEDTGGFQNFVRREVGELRLAAGRQALRVEPRTKPGPAVMDLREVRLIRID
jgi:arylsulfatase A-like enzyme